MTPPPEEGSMLVKQTELGSRRTKGLIHSLDRARISCNLGGEWQQPYIGAGVGGKSTSISFLFCLRSASLTKIVVATSHIYQTRPILDTNACRLN